MIDILVVLSELTRGAWIAISPPDVFNNLVGFGDCGTRTVSDRYPLI